MLTTTPHHAQPRVPQPATGVAHRGVLSNRSETGTSRYARSGLRPTAEPALPPVPTYARPGLSAREITVLKAWLDCDSKLGVAAHLHIALGTVNTHLSRIRDKYARVGRSAPTKAALVARALQDGIVALDEL